jgi:hypothetical protein
MLPRTRRYFLKAIIQTGKSAIIHWGLHRPYSASACQVHFRNNPNIHTPFPAQAQVNAAFKIGGCSVGGCLLANQVVLYNHFLREIAIWAINAQGQLVL